MTNSNSVTKVIECHEKCLVSFGFQLSGRVPQIDDEGVLGMTLPKSRDSLCLLAPELAGVAHQDELVLPVKRDIHESKEGLGD
jgi:hypothetical protein